MSIKYGLEYVGYIDLWTDEERLSDEEIVRCRDCEHARHYHPFYMGKRSAIEEWYCEWHSNAEGASEIEPDGYCSWGKRRDA